MMKKLLSLDHATVADTDKRNLQNTVGFYPETIYSDQSISHISTLHHYQYLQS